MSEPKRYTPDYTFTGTAFVPTTREVGDGEYVRYCDYADLKAERDAIHSSKLVYFIHGEGRWANVVDENARLKAEVERLTELNKKIMATADIIDASNQRLIKAGDEFVSLLEHEEYDMESAGIKDMVDAWNAAKNLNS